MQGVHSYFVDGRSVYVPDDELDEFMADCRERGAQVEEADVYSATNADGETREFSVPRSQSEAFLADAADSGGRADRMRAVDMGDGTRLTLGEGAVRQFVQARRNGATMSRGLLKMAGIPETYARGLKDREKLADELAFLFPDEAAPDGRGSALDSFGDALYRGGGRVAAAVGGAAQGVADKAREVADAAARSPAVAAAKGAAQGFAEGLTPEGVDEYYGEGSTVGNMVKGANDFANAATKGAATTLSYALGGQSTAAGRAVRGWADSLRTDAADMETGSGDVANAVLGFAKEFSQNTLSTIGRYAVPGAAAVDIAGGVIDNYCDAYARAVANGADAARANALATAAAGIGAAEGIWLAKAVNGGANAGAIKGLLTRAAGMGGKMGAAGAVRDVVEQGIEGADSPDLVRTGKAALKSGAEGAAFELAAAGTRALADRGRRADEAASARRVREGIDRERREAETRERYEGRLSDEAEADIAESVGKMVETGVLPTDATAPEVARRAREKLGGRERGESHEAVEQAVMEAAQEVGERLSRPERVTSDALERRQVEARMRDNERWARRSDELAAEYGREEAARRVAEEQEAEARRKEAEAVQGEADAEARSARKSDFEAALRAERAAKDREITARRQAEVAEQKRQAEEYDRAERERAEAEREETEAAPTMNEERNRDYHAWLRKHGRKDNNKNFRKWVKSEGVELVSAEDAEFIRGVEAVKREGEVRQARDEAKRKAETVAALQRMADETASRFADERGREAWERRADLDRRAKERARAEEESLAANEAARADFERKAESKREAAERAEAEPLPQTRENVPVSVPTEAAATLRPEAAKPAEAKKTANAATQGGEQRERLLNMSQAAQVRHYDVSRLTGADFNEANLSAKELEHFKDLYRDYAKGGSAAEHDAARDALKAFVNAHGEAVVPSAPKSAPAAPPLSDRSTAEPPRTLTNAQGEPIDKSGRRLPTETAEPARPAQGAQAPAPKAEAAKTKPAARQGATAEQLADFNAKIAEAEKAGNTAKDEAARKAAKFSVSVGTTSLTFNATKDGIAAAKKVMEKLRKPTDWNRQPPPERVPTLPKPTKVADKPADADETLKGFVLKNPDNDRKELGRPLTRKGYTYATDGMYAVRVKAKPGAKDDASEKIGGALESMFAAAPDPGTEAKTTTAELETALAQAKTVKGGRTRGDRKGAKDYDNDVVEVWRTKDGGIAVRARSAIRSNGELDNVTPTPDKSDADRPSDAAFFSGETLDGAKLLGIVSGNRLAEVCKAFAKRGDGSLSVETHGGNIFCFRGKNVEAVIARKRFADGDDLQGYEAAAKRHEPLYSLSPDGEGDAQGTPRTFHRVRVNPNLRADVARAMNTDAAKGAVAHRREVVRLSDTPDALHALGMPSAEIITKAEILRKVNRKHNISADEFAEIPDAYADPVAVFRNGESYVVLTGKKARTADGEEKPVMVYLRPAAKRDTFLASAYAREGSKEAAYVNWARKGDLLFLDKEKAALVGLKDETLSQLTPLAKSGQIKMPQGEAPDTSPRSIAKNGAGAQGAPASGAKAERVDMRRLDPKRRSVPKVVAWAKKNGRTVSDGRVTPDAVREYDAQMAQGAARAVRRWFPDMSVTYHDYGEHVTRGRHAIDLRDTAGRVLGWFEPTTKDIHLLPGADAATVAHEIMWHGSRDWAMGRAAAGDKRAQALVRAMRAVEVNAPDELKRRVKRLYREKGADTDTLFNEFGAWATMGRGGEALEAAMAKAENRAWYAKSLNVVKETVKDYLSAHGKNRVDLSKVDGMGRDEFVKFLADAFAGGKTLGEIGAKGKVADVPTKETLAQKLRRKVYDVNAALRDLQRDIERKTGRKVSENEDAEAANALTPGLREAAVMDVRGKLDGYRALLKETGISDADAQYYMALKAAAGRDAKVDARNLAKLDAKAEAEVLSEWGKERAAKDDAGFKAAVEVRKAEYREAYRAKNGSHVSPVEAWCMLTELEGGEHAEGYGKIREYLRGVMDATLDAQVRSGLVSREAAEKFRADEPDYIPFKNEFDAASGEFVGRGGVNLGRPEHFTAKGRTSSAGDITAHIFGDYQATLFRGIETDVRQRLAALVRANPELGRVEKVGADERPREKAKSDRTDPGNATGDPNLVLFKQGGDTYAIRLNGERGSAIAAALTERNVRRLDGWFPKFARASAALATRWSPTFSVRNFTKDNIELANIVFSEKGAVEGAKWVARYVKSQAQMAGTLAKFVTTGKVDATTEQGRVLRKYIDAGGLIGGGATEGYDAMKRSFTPEAIAREVKRGKSRARAVADKTLHAVAYLNEFAELTTRVNAFAAELKGGATEREAALFSRRATVDFNRKGENTGVTNVVRLFSNSTLGATARATTALAKSRTGKAMAAALFANGFAQALVEEAMNGGEDERRRKTGEATGRDVPEFERKTALFFIRSGDNVYKVAQHESPFSLFNYAGNCAGRVVLGRMSAKDMAKNLGVSVAELAYHFTGMGTANLTSGDGDVGDDVKTALVSGLCPSALQPIAETLVGTDYKGDRLYRQNYSTTAPDSATAKKQTPEYAKTAAAWMNEATGGNEARKGYVDIHPEAVQKLVEGFGKNAARDVMNAYEVGKAVLDGDLKRLTPRDVPVKRDFVRPLDGNTSRFFEAYDAYRADEAEFKGMREKWTADERREYLAAHPWLKYGKTGKRAVAVLVDGLNRERPRTGVASMGVKQLRKLSEGLVRMKSGAYAEPKRPVTDEEKERAKREMMRKQALVLEKMGR